MGEKYEKVNRLLFMQEITSLRQRELRHSFV